MKLTKALEIVLNLATQNKISNLEDPDMIREAKKQKKAIEIVSDFYYNHADEFQKLVKCDGKIGIDRL